MFKYFTLEEFDCQETGENGIKEEFVAALDTLREKCGFSFRITSGYRSPRHSVEVKKPHGPGQHGKGIAADIAINNGRERYIIVANALELGFSGIGIAKTFVHVDIRQTTPVIWTYK